MPVPGPICLYAVVPRGEADELCATTRGLLLVVCGPVAAVIGKPGNETEPRAALRHDRIVGRALDVCSSVVPFRLGVELQSGAELRRVLGANEKALSGHLARFRERVEMGLKAKLATQADGGAMRLPFGIERVRALAPRNEDRRERLKRVPSGQVFEGCYLISRQTIAAFWSAVEDIRRTLPDLPLMGSGPWAAYSFCDFALRFAQSEQRIAIQTQ
ncbi:MAG TPA: GvpL/GvpF family gas vesicle protein [Myxococcota bacterium]|nr:GvpL/GvpF family gas vesicle protein [Myxococcota bacterium]